MKHLKAAGNEWFSSERGEERKGREGAEAQLSSPACRREGEDAFPAPDPDCWGETAGDQGTGCLEQETEPSNLSSQGAGC